MVPEVVTPMRVGVVVTALVALGFGVSLVGRKKLRSTLTDRFVYGVPWGSLLVVGGVVAFYLFAQSGLHHWDDPVTVAFRSWAYPYPTGMLTAGFAHASPSHLLGNVLAAVVLAPIAEFIWGHYPHGHTRTGATRPAQRPKRQPPATPEPAEFDNSPGNEGVPTGQAVADGSTATSESGLPGQTTGTRRERQHSNRLRDRPAVRALVIFPGAVVAVSLLTSLYALGWSLGFSGTVFAFLGFVLLRYPIPTAVALLGVSLLNTLVNTLLTPVLRATAESGPPQPPGWAGVNVQAHMLGFLVGALLALLLLWKRAERPDPARLFGATVLVATAQGLWQLSTATDGVFVRYQGLGVVFVLLLAVFVTHVATAENGTLSRRVSLGVRGFAGLWLLGVVAVAAGALLIFGTGTMTLLSVAAITPVVALPGVALVAADGGFGSPMTTRRLLFVSLLFVAVVLALPSVAGNSLGIDGESVPDGAVTIDGYHVGYAENASSGRTGATDSGLVVASEQRYVWTVAASDDVLAHDGTATVPVGGIGWRETVRAERAGWDVVGNDSAYTVDLETDETTIRSFTSGSSRASVTLADSRIVIVPAEDGFALDVTRDGESIGSTRLPDRGQTTAVGSLQFTTEKRDGTDTLFASTADSRVVLAQKE